MPEWVAGIIWGLTSAVLVWCMLFYWELIKALWEEWSMRRLERMIRKMLADGSLFLVPPE